ncbi:orotidine-5'-phosphate decarboxylase [Bacillus sp. FJAT-44742]|uniref:orotidine-5'-phosphate decarboxylase n=1 Tax=Bacillus sp. FJAT-44742 TaxID=2014005 RepID=UPI000C24406B|nr:orotidine-5'-phosphate decarboxylase [Bacillus sp. FJAT-44742]
MDHPLIIALDFPEKEKALKFLSLFSNESLYVKVGMELFYSEGPHFVEEIKSRGHGVFLDLKLHDIPNTVKSAMERLARLNVDIVNVHAAGGKQMMEAAIEGLDKGTISGNKRPACIAVTQLTSTTEKMLTDDLLISEPMEAVVSHYARNTKASGLDGVVCSALEVPVISRECGGDFLKVTPGIRMDSEDKGDQHRVATPERARELGSTAIVVGRSITQAQDPLAAYYDMNKLWRGQI